MDSNITAIGGTKGNGALIGLADIIIESMDCGVFLLSKEREIKALNNAGKTFLREPEDNVLSEPFGNAIGCKNATERYDCGQNPSCKNCQLLKTVEKILEDSNPDVGKMLDKKTIVRDKENIDMYFQYTFKSISVGQEKNILLMVDDVSDLEKHKEKVEEKNKQLLGSISYAKRIQEALLPTKHEIYANLKDYFLIYEPRDIIGGDFYWTAKVGQKIIVAIADCTGHGIPGALLTILGISTLNEIVITNKETQPDQILNKLRKQIVGELNKIGSKDTHDGMDMGICTIDTENKTLSFAGALNNMIFIKDGDFKEIKGDKMPIGLYNKMDKFTLKEFEYAQGDGFYLFSDGYKDQFGGPLGKKYGKAQLTDLLRRINKKESSTQKEILLDTFRKWKKNEIQIDDVSVLGVKLI